MLKIVSTQGTGSDTILKVLLAPLGGAWFLVSVQWRLPQGTVGPKGKYLSEATRDMGC